VLGTGTLATDKAQPGGRSGSWCAMLACFLTWKGLTTVLPQVITPETTMGKVGSKGGVRKE
jgi:hypothetical protein